MSVLLWLIYLFLSTLLNMGTYCEQLFELDDFGPHPEYVNELQAKKDAVIAPGVVIPAEINVTSKGNGILTIANVNIHVFDIHDDSEMFRDELLKILLIDFSADGWRDLVIYGIEDEYDEKSGEKIGERPMFYTYRYNPETKEFDNLQFTPEWRSPVKLDK